MEVNCDVLMAHPGNVTAGAAFEHFLLGSFVGLLCWINGGHCSLMMPLEMLVL